MLLGGLSLKTLFDTPKEQECIDYGGKNPIDRSRARATCYVAILIINVT